ncbi:MAG: hypothetical protein H6817_09620 [Phycisphaerales bacterium]|nr:hypothetical protein [Phycisphaerales bacterium]
MMTRTPKTLGGNTTRPVSARTWTQAACVLFAIGAGLRSYLAITLPVGYDESYVMALGLNAMTESTSALLLDVPLTHSSAITPLWWWIQYVPRAIAPDISLFVLRIMPALFGVLTLWIAWRCSAARFGRRIAVYFLAFISLSDILIFTNCRGEFAESFTVPLIVLLACQVGTTRRAWLRGVLWALLLLTGLVKGIFVILLMLLAEGVLLVAARRDVARRIGNLAISLVMAVIPAGAYLIWGNQHFAGHPIAHEATTAPNVFALTRALLFDYTTIKKHVTGSALDAAFIALDFDVWPAMAMMAPLLLAACVVACISIARNRFHAGGRLAQARIALTVWSVAGAAVVIERGTLGARFHLMYLPALWLLAAIWLGRLRYAAPTRVVIAGLVWAACVGFAGSRISWSKGVLDTSYWLSVIVGLTGITALAAWFATRTRRSPILVAMATMGIVMALAELFAGPLAWRAFARFEPMPRGTELTLLDAFRSGESPNVEPRRSLYIDLANCYMIRSDSQADHERALHYAQIEVERVPDDPRAWAYLGETLLAARKDPREVRRAWQRSLELAPKNVIQDKLDRLEAWMNSNGLLEQP